MHTYLRRLVEERTALTRTITDLSERAAGEDRDLTDTERATITTAQTRCTEIDAQLVEHNAQADSIRAFADLQARIAASDAATDSRVETRTQRGAPANPVRFGAGFTDSEEFRSYSGRGTSGIVEFGSVLEARALITTDQLGIPAYEWTGPSDPSTLLPLTAAVSRERVSSGVVEWVDYAEESEPAAPVAEGAAKPEATFATVPSTATLETWAHWYQITRQALEDKARIQSILEGRLVRGLQRKIEKNIAAVLPDAALDVDAADLLSAVRLGIAEVQMWGYAPTAIILNPADYAAMDISIFNPAIPAGQVPTVYGSYWGLPIIPSVGVAVGTAYVGDPGEAVTLFERGTTQVFLTDSHADLFIKNTLVLLAETRNKAVMTNANALCACTVTTPPPLQAPQASLKK